MNCIFRPQNILAMLTSLHSVNYLALVMKTRFVLCGNEHGSWSFKPLWVMYSPEWCEPQTVAWNWTLPVLNKCRYFTFCIEFLKMEACLAGWIMGGRSSNLHVVKFRFCLHTVGAGITALRSMEPLMWASKTNDKYHQHRSRHGLQSLTQLCQFFHLTPTPHWLVNIEDIPKTLITQLVSLRITREKKMFIVFWSKLFPPAFILYNYGTMLNSFSHQACIDSS
jgi:hypothetical protein